MFPDEAAAGPPPVQPPISSEIPKKARRQPHPHVTSIAHAGYCMIVDMFKAYVRDALHEPNFVYVDKAAEMILTQHMIEQTWMKPEENVRDKLTHLLGCKITWDAPHFRLTFWEAPELGPVNHPVYVEGSSDRPSRWAYAVPFATLPPRVELSKKIRPFDNIDDVKVVKEDVPAGKSMTEHTATAVAGMCQRPPLPRRFL